MTTYRIVFDVETGAHEAQVEAFARILYLHARLQARTMLRAERVDLLGFRDVTPQRQLGVPGVTAPDASPPSSPESPRGLPGLDGDGSSAS